MAQIVDYFANFDTRQDATVMYVGPKRYTAKGIVQKLVVEVVDLSRDMVINTIHVASGDTHEARNAARLALGYKPHRREV